MEYFVQNAHWDSIPVSQMGKLWSGTVISLAPDEMIELEEDRVYVSGFWFTELMVSPYNILLLR